jgi:Ca2+-binding RTX toxin-like protein
MAVSATTYIRDNNHAVTYIDANGQSQTIMRLIETRVFAPSTPGEYPVILYSHGHTGSPFADAGKVAASLADQGYIVIAPTHLDSLRMPAAIQDDFGLDVIGVTALHRVADMQFLLTNATTVTAALPGYTANLADPTMAGHSMGAYTSALLTGVTSTLPEIAGLAAGNPYGLTTVADARFKQVIMISPQGYLLYGENTFGFNEHSWDNHTLPSLSITGTRDSLNQTYHDRLIGFDSGAYGNKHALVIKDADHFQVGGESSVPALNAEVTAAAALFLQSYVGNNAVALATLNDVAAYTQAHPLVVEAYHRSGGSSQGSLTGTAAADILTGLSTNDVLNGGVGADNLNGGNGWDTASYANAAAAVQVVMYNTAYNTGEAAGDVFTGIEALQGSANIDILVGDFAVNAILGGAGGDWIDGTYGGDYLYGEAGNDSLVSRLQADVLDGGADFDYARYDYADAGLRAYINDTTQNSGWAAGDTFVSIEGLAGSYFADDLRGDASQNIIYGLGGADFIIGLGGADLLIGGDGQDLFHFMAIGDGGTGGDAIQDFVSGFDRISVTGSAFGLGSPGGVAIDSFRFVAGSGASLATSQFIYNGATRQLFYDQDGTGAGVQVLLATLQAGATMAAGDVLVI